MIKGFLSMKVLTISPPLPDVPVGPSLPEATAARAVTPDLVAVPPPSAPVGPKALEVQRAAPSAEAEMLVLGVCALGLAPSLALGFIARTEFQRGHRWCLVTGMGVTLLPVRTFPCGA